MYTEFRIDPVKSPNILHKIINGYSRKTNNWKISFDGLLNFIDNLVINDEAGKYSVFITNTSDVVTAMLMELEKSGICELAYNGSTVSIIKNYGYVNIVVQQAYEKMEANSEYPFPTQQSIGMAIPDECLTNLHLPDGLTSILNSGAEDEEKIYRLVLNGGLDPVIVSSSIIGSRMLVLAVSKIRNFLTYKNNANFIYQKMVPAFSKNTRALIDTIKTVQSNPGRAATALKKPDEFIFSFWTQMCGYLRKDLSGKENKTDHDEGLLQSAFLINSFILYYKNIILRGKKRAEALRAVGERLRKEPYFFTISDIYDFRDKNGLLIENQYGKEDLHDFLNEKFKLKENELLPELIKVKTVNNKLYYIHRLSYLTLVSKKINDAHDYYRRKYLDDWVAELKNYESPNSMNSDELFNADLEQNIKKEDPLLYAILGFDLLYLAINETKNVKLKAVAQGWIDPKTRDTRPLPVILNLSRRLLASEVRSLVPFWLTFGFFRKLAAMFGGGKKSKNKKKTSLKAQLGTASVPRSTAASAGRNNTSAGGSVSSGSKSAGRLTEYKRGVENLKQSLNYNSSNAPQRIEELSNQWNPLLDNQARNNLVKDVNNMVRDYMRKILRETAFAVPDAERVNNIADMLSGNRAFSVIKKKDSFKQYIVMYIIKILSETRP